MKLLNFIVNYFKLNPKKCLYCKNKINTFNKTCLGENHKHYYSNSYGSYIILQVFDKNSYPYDFNSMFEFHFNLETGNCEVLNGKTKHNLTNFKPKSKEDFDKYIRTFQLLR